MHTVQCLILSPTFLDSNLLTEKCMMSFTAWSLGHFDHFATLLYQQQPHQQSSRSTNTLAIEAKVDRNIVPTAFNCPLYIIQDVD